MEVQHDVDLAPFTTLGLHAKAESFVRVQSVEELQQALDWSRNNNAPFRILGGGSNVLVSKNLPGLLILMDIRGRHATQNGDVVLITLGAGEQWHDVVQWCVQQGWHGLENLALIPGTVGAAPMQNIGAYGAEQRDCFESLRYVDVNTGGECVADAAFCAFGYRDSVFKQDLREKAVITSVTYRLNTNTPVNTSYADVSKELAANGVDNATIDDVFHAIVAIRRRKLPDPAVLGNAGSFYKNPVMTGETFEQLQIQHPELPGYVQQDGTVKVPAAWLIDRCGWKGHREGNVGVHAHQALVLVNLGDGTGNELLQLAQRITKSVEDTFGLTLEPEVNVW